MLRLYLDYGCRLHIWHSSLRVPHVTEVHAHPWDFTSTVIAGQLINRRYCLDEYGKTYLRHLLKCGEGGGLVGQVEPCKLKECFPEVYAEGQSYSQMNHEIHRTEARNGTVTICQRRFRSDADHANVYVMQAPDVEFVSAEPRPATLEEVRFVTENALLNWFL